jgi:ureidoglycolate hydrolase
VGPSIVIAARPLEPDAWAPFGWVPVPDTDPADGRHTLEFQWHDPHLNLISHAPSEVARAGAGMVVERLYRHDTHTQALVPLNCEAVIAVAPAAVTFTEPNDLDAIHAFQLRPIDRIVLHRGTWHWGPFPVGDEPVQLLNVQGQGYADDNACVDLLESLGSQVMVELSH